MATADPVTVTLGSGDIHLLNPVNPDEVQQRATEYLAGDSIPPVVVATYNGRQLSVDGCHRLSALAKLVQSGKLDPAVASSDKYVLTINGDEESQKDPKVREALDFLEACCLNPVEPESISWDDIERGTKLQLSIRTLAIASPKAIKQALWSDAGGGFL